MDTVTAKVKNEINYVLDDFENNEDIEICKEVYGLTIAANITKACNPIEL